jgi:CRISPR/Cas system-associated endonuclease/helicase Cas3
MSKVQKLDQKSINQDINAFNGLKSIPDYVPIRSDLSLPAMENTYQNMLQAQRRAVELEAQQKMAIADKLAAENEFHAKVIDMKNCVRGQFGLDSNEVQVIGFKKQSQRKKATRKKVALEG